MNIFSRLPLNNIINISSYDCINCLKHEHYIGDVRQDRIRQIEALTGLDGLS